MRKWKAGHSISEAIFYFEAGKEVCAGDTHTIYAPEHNTVQMSVICSSN